MKKLTKPFMLIVGGLLILLGIISIFNPLSALSALSTYIGFALFVTGVMYIFSYVRNSYRERPSWVLSQGLIDTLFGILLMFNNNILALSVAYLIALWAFVTGVLRITSALELKKSAYSNWGILFAVGLISLVFSIMVFSHPVIGAGLAAFALGVMFIVLGIGTIAQCDTIIWM